MILNLSELNKVMPVVDDYEVPKTRYLLDLDYNCDVFAKAYKKGKEVPEEDIEIGPIIVDNFDDFFKEVKSYFPRNIKLSISKDYALVLLALYNGGEADDYDDQY